MNRWLARLLFPWTAFCETSILEVDQAGDALQQLVFYEDVAVVSSDISAMYLAIRVEDSIDGLQGLFRLIQRSADADLSDQDENAMIDDDDGSAIGDGQSQQSQHDRDRSTAPDHVLLTITGEPRDFSHLPRRRADGRAKPTRREILSAAGWILEEDWHVVLTLLFEYALGGVVIKTATRSGFNYYSQEKELAMGYSLSPVAAILAVWYRCELPMIGQIYSNTYLMGRYIDDIIIVALSDNPNFSSQAAVDR